MIDLLGALFVVGLLVVFASLWVRHYNDAIALIMIIGGGLLAICALIVIAFFLSSSQTSEIKYTGEIIKFYANGTGLLDNGTLIYIKSAWGLC